MGATDLSEREVILTADGLRRLEEELRELQGVRRQEVAEHIRQAKSYGDIAENPEYEDAKTEQAFIEGRIADIKNIISSAVVIEPEEIPTDRVGLGSLVTVRDLEFEEDWTFRMVGSIEANPEADLVSNESPIGEAMLGHVVGDLVEVDTPGGKGRFEILAIRRPEG